MRVAVIREGGGTGSGACVSLMADLPVFGVLWRRYNTPCGKPGPLNTKTTLARTGRAFAFPEEMHMTAARFERSREALVKDFADVLTEADTLLKQAAKESGDKASDLRAQVEAKLRSAKLKLQD